jgi:hypothetical protein
MSPKLLLILLVVIAILTVMIIGVGYRRDKTDREYEQKGAFSGFDKFFARFRDPLDVSRLTGCGSNGQTLTLGAECDVVILPGKSNSSAFKLVPTAGVVRACFGFERDQIEDCIEEDDADKRTKLKSDSRFVVGKGQAVLRLYCTPPPSGGSSCVVRIVLDD